MKRAASALLAVFVIAAACSEPTTPVASAIRGGLNPNTPRSNAEGGPTAIFGPEQCLRETGKPVPEPFPFSASVGAATLVVTDNGVLGLNGTIELNGKTVVYHPNVGGNDPLNLSVPVTLIEGSNTLVCKLEGKPGSGLTMTVTVP